MSASVIVVEVTASAIPGPPGTPGPPGPQGPPGTSVSYIHYQTVPAQVWYVQHNLGRHPWVQAEDAAGTLIFGTVQHQSNNLLTVTLAVALTGRVNCA